MAVELEVDFCDLCNTSVPVEDLESGAAKRIHGKLIGRCCLAPLTGNLPPAEAVAAAATSPVGVAAAETGRAGARTGGGSIAGVFVLLVAIAGTAVFLDWRLGDEVQQIRGEFADLGREIDRHNQKLADLEGDLVDVARAADVTSVRSGLTEFGETISAQEERLQRAVGATGTAIEQLQSRFDTLADAQGRYAARLGNLHDELRNVGRDVADIKAAPRTAIVSRPIDVPVASETRDDPVVDDGVPAAMAHNIDRLADADAGTRFEAVDELLSTNDARIYGHILPLAKDPDPFVRRLVVEGLGGHRSTDSVEALLVGLADPESIVRHTAFTSLRKLTGQTIAFDPDASRDQRSTMQRRWRQWWDRNKADFF